MLYKKICLCLLFICSTQLKAEHCNDSMNHKALDLNYENHRMNDYRWQSKSFFSMDYVASCISTRYDINLNVSGTPSRRRSNILDLNTSGGLKENGDRWMRHDAMFMGYKYHGLNKSGTSVSTSFSLDFASFQFLDLGYTYGIGLGPIQAGARVGVSGEVSISGGISKVRQSRNLSLGLFPGFDIYGYAKVGAGLASIAEVWAGGHLSFIKESLSAELVVAEQEAKLEENLFPQRQVTMRVYNTLEFLSGKLYAKATLLFTTWEHRFIEFWGYRRTREVWNSDDKMNVKRSSNKGFNLLNGQADEA